MRKDGARQARDVAGASRAKDADTKAFEKDLSDALGLKVELKPGSGESGIEPPAGVDGQYFMVRPLSAYDPALRGQAVYSEAFLKAG